MAVSYPALLSTISLLTPAIAFWRLPCIFPIVIERADPIISPAVPLAMSTPSWAATTSPSQCTTPRHKHPPAPPALSEVTSPTTRTRLSTTNTVELKSSPASTARLQSLRSKAKTPLRTAARISRRNTSPCRLYFNLLNLQIEIRMLLLLWQHPCQLRPRNKTNRP